MPFTVRVVSCAKTDIPPTSSNNKKIFEYIDVSIKNQELCEQA